MKRLKNGTLVKVKKFSIINQVGGTSLGDVIVKAKIIKSFYDYECGMRYIGELINEEDIKTANELGLSEFTPEDYKEHGEQMYLDTLRAFEEYNPKIVYFSEFAII